MSVEAQRPQHEVAEGGGGARRRSRPTPSATASAEQHEPDQRGDPARAGGCRRRRARRRRESPTSGEPGQRAGGRPTPACCPGSRWAASSPAIPPTTRPDEGEEPELPDGRGPQRGGAVDRGEQHVAHLGPLEGERAAAAARAQAEGEREGGQRRRSSPGRRRSTLRQLGGRRAASSPTMLDSDGDGDEAEDAGQVGLVERVDPVDVGGPLLPAEPPPVLEVALEVGVGISGRGAAWRLQPLDDHGHALAAADAHRLEAVAAAGVLEAVDAAWS